MQSRAFDNRLYILGDILTSFLACVMALNTSIISSFSNVSRGLFTHPYLVFGYVIAWILFYTIFDSYRDIYRQSRMAVLAKTFALGLIGVLSLYLMVSQGIIDFPNFSFWRLLFIHILLTVFIRMFIMTRASKKLKSGVVGFNTIIIGNLEKAYALNQDLHAQSANSGHNVVGFVASQKPKELKADFPYLGSFDDIDQIIEDYQVEEALLAIDKKDPLLLKRILSSLFEFKDKVLIKVVPDLYDILLGSVKLNHVFGAVLIEVRQELMPKWQKIVKRLIDLIVSMLALLLLSPFLLYIAIRVRLSSPGSILYLQKRVGYKGRPFRIFKFRSMYMNAEENGPSLSATDDPRCTKWGAIMRKWRIDELPQFWNVLIGEMSLVGPRPERAYYIEKIMERAPHYRHLLKVKPGITSWGQVKYGYASDVDQMIKRLQFDILYIENMSLTLDFKIFVYTVLVLIQGKGK